MPEIYLIYLQKIRFVFKAEARVSERLYPLITNSSSSQKLGFANSNVDHGSGKCNINVRTKENGNHAGLRHHITHLDDRNQQ